MEGRKNSSVSSIDDKDESSNTLHIVAISDVNVGKFGLIHYYVTKTYPENFTVNGFVIYEKNVTFGGETYQLNITFESGYDELDALKPYADVILLCFSLIERSSFENISKKWYPEMRKHCPQVPIVLVGTKSDMRGKSEELITTEEGMALKKKIGAASYFECSAKENLNVEEVFSNAIRLAVDVTRTKKRKQKKDKCSIC